MSVCVHSEEAASMWTEAAEILLHISTSTHLCHSSYSPPTVSWLSHASLPAAASFQTLRFPPATGQTAVRASSVSPSIRPTDEDLLQKLTVHHKTSCTRRWVVTSQAERPSAHGGVREIFLSLSVPGQRAQDWHRALLMKENGGKHQKLSWGQNEDVKDTRGVCLCIWNVYIFYIQSLCLCSFECMSVYSLLTTSSRLITTYINILCVILCHVQTVMVPRGWMLLILMIPWLYL